MGTLLPAFGESIGLEEELSVYLVSIMSIADFCGRYVLIICTKIRIFSQASGSSAD